MRLSRKCKSSKSRFGSFDLGNSSFDPLGCGKGPWPGTEQCSRHIVPPPRLPVPGPERAVLPASGPKPPVSRQRLPGFPIAEACQPPVRRHFRCLVRSRHRWNLRYCWGLAAGSGRLVDAVPCDRHRRRSRCRIADAVHHCRYLVRRRRCRAAVTGISALPRP